jgi:hypothetical protein
MKIERLGENIFVYHDFLTMEELTLVNQEIVELGDEVFSPHVPDAAAWNGHIPSIYETVTMKIKNLLSNGYSIKEHSSAMRMAKGKVWSEHCDNDMFKEDLERSKTLVEGEPYDEVDYPEYGLIVYFNEFEGGQIEYTKQGIIYQPKPGDLILHGSDETCSHRVLEVLSDYRYSYSNAIYRKLKIPKS